MSVRSVIPAILERHELKYSIPVSYIDPISRFIKPYCDLDYHSAIAPDEKYVINSLYFDTRTLEFLQQRMYGKDGRFNVRVRSYGEEGRAPFFLEIKRKSGGTGKKYRAIAQADEWPSILTHPDFRVAESKDSQNTNNLNLFLRIALSYDIAPKILTQYRRKAFVSTVDEYARVTFDTDLRYRLQEHYDITPDSGLINYDEQAVFGHNQLGEENVILELKCNVGQVPMWMLDLISTFELKQQGFSKYLNSSLAGSLIDGHNYMSRDRAMNC